MISIIPYTESPICRDFIPNPQNIVSDPVVMI